MPSWGSTFFNHDDNDQSSTYDANDAGYDYHVPGVDAFDVPAAEPAPEPTAADTPFEPEAPAAEPPEPAPTADDHPGDTGPTPADASETDASETDASPSADASEPTPDDTGMPADKTPKAEHKMPRIRDNAAKAIVAVLDTLATDEGLNAARTVLGVTATSKASLLAAASGVKSRGIPKLDHADAKRIVDAVDALGTDEGVAVAKIFTDTNSPNKASLLAALSEAKTRKRVDEAFRQIGRISDWAKDPDLFIVNMALAFNGDEKNPPLSPKLVFGILNAAAPDRGFGKPSGDVRRDAKTIVTHWDGGVDLSSLNTLRL